MNLYEMFEDIQELTLVDALRDFLPIAMDHLHISKLPKIHLRRDMHDTHVPTFGRFQNDSRIVSVDVENRHPNDILRTIAHELVHFAQGERGELDSESWHTGSPEEDEANAEAGVIMRKFNTKHPQYLKLGPVVLPKQVNEKWSQKYKRSIDCSNPKGFSQRAHCQGRKKSNESTADDINKLFGNMYDPMVAALQRVALLAMQGRHNEAQSHLSRALRDINPQAQKKVIDAVNAIKPVTINGKVADSSTLDKSKAHQDWIVNTFIPWVQTTVNQKTVQENFADGKKPGRKGLAKRMGVNCKQSISKLRSIAKSSSGERQRMAHWCANMKSGRSK